MAYNFSDNCYFFIRNSGEKVIFEPTDKLNHSFVVQLQKKNRYGDDEINKLGEVYIHCFSKVLDAEGNELARLAYTSEDIAAFFKIATEILLAQPSPREEYYLTVLG